MREIRLHGSEGGGAELNRLSLPLSSSTLRVVFQPSPADRKRTRSVEDGIPTEDRGNESQSIKAAICMHAFALSSEK